jgi:hypothetical protein
VAYAVHTLHNCHEYDPGGEIMGLAKSFTKSQRMNASENFHMHLHMTSSYAMNSSIKTYNLN